MSRYETGSDPYLIPDTEVHKNILGIIDPQSLEAAEQDAAFKVAREMRLSTAPFTFQQLCGLHRRLFSEVYAWAGETRIIPMSKGTSVFAQPEFIERDCVKVYARLNSEFEAIGRDENSVGAMLGMACADLNVAHPFREGNGRSIRLHLEHNAFHLDCLINWNSVSESQWINLSIQSMSDESTLVRWFSENLVDISPILDE